MDEPQKEQHWTGIRTVGPNGTRFLRSNLFIFLLGQLMVAVVGIVGFGVTYGQSSQKIFDITNRLSERIGHLEAVGGRMDEQGTNFSHYTLQSDQQRISANEERLHEVEKQTKEIPVLIEKINRIDEAVKQHQK